MNTASLVSFMRIIRTYPKLLDDRKAMQKTINKIGDEAFKERKKKIHDDIATQKREIMECYDKYKEIVPENVTELIMSSDEMRSGIEHLPDKFIEALFPKKEKPNEQD